MASRVFRFLDDQGVSLSDPQSKSTIGAIFANAVDLLNCGTEDYVELTQSGNLILPTVNCGPPLTYLSLSLSGVGYLGSFTQFDGSIYTGPRWDVSINNMLGYLIDNIYNPTSILGDPAVYDPTLADVAIDEPWNLKKGQWFASEGDFQYNLSVPRKGSVKDNCGVIFGDKSSAAIQVQVKDEFCQPKLVAVLSAKLAIRTGSFTTAQANTAATVFSDYLGIQAGAIQGRIPSPFVSSIDTVNQWRADHPNLLTQVTIVDNT